MNTERIRNGIFYALMSIVAIFIGLLSCRIAISAGANDTEVTTIYWCIIVLCAVIYFSAKLAIYNAFNWLFNKYAPKAKKVEIVEEPSPIVEEIAEETEQPIEPKIEIEEEQPADQSDEKIEKLKKHIVQQEDFEEVDEEIIEEEVAPIPAVEPTPMLDLDKIRQDKAVQESNELQERINIAHIYTQYTLVPHMSDEAMVDMLHNINIYATMGDNSELRTVRTKGLQYYDLFHYGWNIWKYFGAPQKQEAIAIFLKAVFHHDLKNFDVLDGITRKLKMVVPNDTIKICDNLTKQVVKG